jgi:hypothetical protein
LFLLRIQEWLALAVGDEDYEKVCGLMWGFCTMGVLNKEFEDKAMQIVKANYQKFSIYDCALLSQVLNKHGDLKEFNLNQYLMDDIQKKAIQFQDKFEQINSKCYHDYFGKDLYNIFHEVVKYKLDLFKEFELEENSVLKNYKIPFLGRRQKVCLIFEHKYDFVSKSILSGKFN